MTLKTKNAILNLGTAVNSLNLVLLIVLFSTYPKLWETQQVVFLSTTFIALVFTLLVQAFYRKSLTAEIILFIVFLSSVSIQSIRIIEPLFRSQTFMIMLLVAKSCLFFKYLGLISLLGSSLFSFSLKKQKIGSWLLITLLISLILSSIIHFNTGFIQNNLLPKIIYYNEELVIAFTITILTSGTFIKNSFDAKNREYIYLGIASLLLSLSLIISFMSINIFTGITISILLILGSIIYLRSMHTITLWS